MKPVLLLAIIIAVSFCIGLTIAKQAHAPTEARSVALESGRLLELSRSQAPRPPFSLLPLLEDVRRVFSDLDDQSADFAKIGAAVLGEEDALVRELGILVLTQAWAREAPEDCLGFFVEHELANLNNSTAILQALFGTWSDSDPMTATAALKRLGPGRAEDILDTITATALAADPVLAVQVRAQWSGLATSPDESQEVWEMLATPGSFDPAAGKWSGDLLKAALEVRLMSMDPHSEATMKWADSFPMPGLREVAITSVVKAMAAEDAEGAREALMRLPQWKTNVEAIGIIATELAKDDLGMGTRWASDSTAGAERYLMIRDLLRIGLHSRPNEAAQAAAELSQLSTTTYINMNEIAGRFAEADPSGALQWLEAMEPGVKADREAVAETIAERWAERNPDEARAATAHLPENLRQGFEAGIAKALGREDPATGWRWAADAAYPSHLVNALIEGEAAADPSTAASRLSSLDLPPEEMNDMVSSLAMAWGRTDPSQAADWLMQREELEQDELPHLLRSFVKQWASADLLNASEWLQKVPSGKSRDRGTAELTRSAIQVAPEVALEWALTIEDPRRKDNAVWEVIYNWAKVINRNDALDALSHPEINEKARQNLLNSITSGF